MILKSRNGHWQDGNVCKSAFKKDLIIEPQRGFVNADSQNSFQISHTTWTPYFKGWKK